MDISKETFSKCTEEMSEYKVKVRINLGRLLPPYVLESIDIYEAEGAKKAVEMAKADYIKVAKANGIDIHDYPLQIIDIERL